MDKITNIFDRIKLIADYKEFKNIRNFAINGLNYTSAEKIYRLKDKNKQPSIEILLDISNKFECINLDWLLTGDGNMLKSENKQPIKPFDGNKIESKVMELLEENRDLHKENKILLTKNNNLEKRIIEFERELSNQKNDGASNSLARTA